MTRWYIFAVTHRSTDIQHKRSVFGSVSFLNPNQLRTCRSNTTRKNTSILLNLYRVYRQEVYFFQTNKGHRRYVELKTGMMHVEHRDQILGYSINLRLKFLDSDEI